MFCVINLYFIFYEICINEFPQEAYMFCIGTTVTHHIHITTFPDHFRHNMDSDILA